MADMSARLINALVDEINATWDSGAYGSIYPDRITDVQLINYPGYGWFITVEIDGGEALAPRIELAKFLSAGLRALFGLDRKT